MARIQRTPRFPKGTRVSKYFNGYASPFGGTVDGFASKTGFYHISYDDGDSEEMTEDDVEVHFHYLPQSTGVAAVPPPPTKKHLTARWREIEARPQRMYSPPPPEASSPDPGNEEEWEKEEEEAGGTFAMVLSLNDNAPPPTRDSRLDLFPLHVDIPKERDAGDEPMQVEEEEEEDEEEEEEEVVMVVEEEDAGETPDETVGADEINRLIGKPVVRQRPKSDGSGMESVHGTVSIFFPATKMFRVLYGSSACEDLSYKEVIDSIPLYSPRAAPVKKRKAPTGPIENTPEQDAPTASPKRPKTLVSPDKAVFPNGETTQNKPKRAAPAQSSASSSPLTPTREELTEFTADTGLDVLRKVLFLLVSTPTITHEMKPKQLKILGSMDMEPKKALRRFVKADGVASLSELLKLWLTVDTAESGVLVILKVLAVLPGVTREVLKKTKIGSRVAYYHKKSPFESKHISELAGWVVEKWRTLVGSKSSSSKSVDSPSPRVDSPKEPTKSTEKTEQWSAKSNDANQKTSKVIENGSKKVQPEATTSKSKEESSREKSNGKERAKSSDTTAAKSAKPKDPLASRQSKSASHLKALLTGGSLRGKDRLAVNGTKKRLGNPNNWRARRSTVVLENVSKRVNEQASEREQQEKRRQEEARALASRRIAFGEADELLFDKEVEPTRLFTWFSSNARFLSRRSTPPPDRPLDYKPKSILKQRSAYPDVVVEENACGPASPSASSKATPTASTSTGGGEGASRPSLLPGVQGDEDSTIRQQTALLSIHAPAHTRPISEAMSPTDERRKAEDSRRCRSPPPPPPEDEDEVASVEDGEVLSADVEMIESMDSTTEASVRVQTDERSSVEIEMTDSGNAPDAVSKEVIMVDAYMAGRISHSGTLSVGDDLLAAAAAADDAGVKHAAAFGTDGPVVIDMDAVGSSASPTVPQQIGDALQSLRESPAATIAREHSRPPPSLST